MSKYVKEFFERGMMWGAWVGPVVLAIVWLCLQKAGVMTTLTVNEAVLGVLTMALLGFLAAGISVVYHIETIPKAFAGLLQGAALYILYLGFYLLNGWLPVDKIWMFTVIFIIGFGIIWFSIYISIKVKVDKINRMMEK